MTNNFSYAAWREAELFLKNLGKMAETGIADFNGRLRNVPLTGQQHFLAVTADVGLNTGARSVALDAVWNVVGNSFGNESETKAGISTNFRH